MPATISYEFFPPRSIDASFKLWETLRALQHTQPDFVSVTYGASGTTRQLTHEAVTAIGRHTGLDVAAHLTCVDASRVETLKIAQRYAEAGVRQIVALRGDPPKGSGAFKPRADGFKTSIELIRALADTGQFELTVGAYPDRHPEAADMQSDIDWLKAKIDAGATRAITQFFFDADSFFRFRDACAASGITAAILPGILPIQSWSGVQRLAQSCGTPIPAHLAQAFEVAERDGRTELLATAVCTQLCTKLLDGGVDHLHFYTLNDPKMTRNVVHALGLAPETAFEKVA
ncbi:MAG: methylenetetrahydrofolate reductase [NAD(P)H] [Paracoccaceae bacterium]|nr:methylenetetrahydrofolate reductase [NAD(P)H] [Paracoccaceae bacterium]